MTVSMVQPPLQADALLPGAQFIDAFCIVTSDTALTARRAADRMFSRSPLWVTALLKLRDIAVAPFGLTQASSARRAEGDKVGFFPLVSETPQRLVAGFDDHHLDFRVVVDVAAAGRGQRVTATTVVLMHNRLGRVYLAVIKPFHRLVVRAMLKQVARRDDGQAPT